MGKKVLSFVLAAIMLISLAACGSDAGTEYSGAYRSGSGMHIAMITDSGDISDQSFNQTTYEACKNWAEINDVLFDYYKPESDSDEARNASIDQAADEGADIIVLSGYVFAASIVSKSGLYPDIKFVALDIGAGDLCEKGVGEEYTGDPEDYNAADYYNAQNVYCCTYQEELPGYMVGYAAVKSGYRHLGFLGGMEVPAVTRFGYGYLQGIDAAAAELGISEEVQVEYACGGQFYGDDEITAVMDTWYGAENVEVVFACGGGIYTSAAEAAAKTGGKLIGVDTDQQPGIDGTYGQGMTVTSAMKGLTETVDDVLTGIRDGKWGDYAGRIENLGIVSEDPEENYVQLPIRSTQWSDAFAEDDYHALVRAMYHGEITVSSDISAMPETKVRVTDHGSIK